MGSIMCKARGAKFYALENQFNVDNGAMIAWLGIEMFNSKNRLKPEEAGIDPYERTDDVKVNWRR
jgi:tRNA A37 threonylcarbamoyltransferase TsaD